jgi:hypothetical protein
VGCTHVVRRWETVDWPTGQRRTLRRDCALRGVPGTANAVYLSLVAAGINAGPPDAASCPVAAAEEWARCGHRSWP